MAARLRFATVAAVLLLSIGATESRAAIFQITNTNDSGPGSLRQAILDSWVIQGPHVIEFDLPLGTSPAVIVLDRLLPPLKGPVVLRVKPAPVPFSPAQPAGGGRGAAGARGGGGPADDAAQAAGGRGAGPAAAPAQAGGRGAGAAASVATPPMPRVVLDGSRLTRPRTPEDCPGATTTYNAQSGQWDNTRAQGSGPNVRGYFGAGVAVHDTANVEISGIELRNFCIGIAVVRSHDVIIENVKVVDSHGAAGVIFTGDDGNAGSTPSAYNNMLLDSELVDNGDGFEFTRGARDSILQGTTITLTRPLPADGNAVEYATSGNNNALMGNTFSKYVSTAVTVGSGRDHTIRDNRIIGNASDGMRVGGENALIFGNTFADNAGDALTVSGTRTRVVDNVFTRNAGRAVVVGALGITVFRNSTYDNGRLAIDVAEPGGGRGGGVGGGRGGPQGRGAAGPGEAAAQQPAEGRGAPPPAAPAAPPAPVVLPNAPVLVQTSRWTSAELVLNGTLAAKPNETYQVQLYISRDPDRHQGEEKGWGEGEKYVGTASARTDGAGRSSFSLMLKIPDIFGDGRTTGYVTATATDMAGSTSRFSRSLQVSQVAR